MGTTNCTTLKVSYTAWQKHKKRGDLTFYCRVREAGQPPLEWSIASIPWISFSSESLNRISGIIVKTYLKVI